MPTNTLAGRTFEVDADGFLTRREDWDEELARALGRLIGQDLTEEHFKVLRFMRDDHADTGITPTIRRLQRAGGFEIKDLFRLFPGKPAKKMVYLAGLRMPPTCV